jgi:hypothetical protein
MILILLPLLPAPNTSFSIHLDGNYQDHAKTQITNPTAWQPSKATLVPNQTMYMAGYLVPRKPWTSIGVRWTGTVTLYVRRHCKETMWDLTNTMSYRWVYRSPSRSRVQEDTRSSHLCCQNMHWRHKVVAGGHPFTETHFHSKFK